MTIRQLEMFKAIVETQRFTTAAERLFVAQPSISQQIHLLEEELGAKLFIRQKNRKLGLTEAGRILKDHADGILRQCQTAKIEISALTNEPVGQIRIGLGGHQLTSMLPPALVAFHRKFPKVGLDIVNGTTPQLVNMLKAGQLDLGVVNFPIQARDLRTEILFTEEMVLIVRSDHPLANRTTVEPFEIASIPLALYDQTTSTRQRLDVFFRERQLSPSILFELSSVEAMKRMVAAGLGASIIPASAVVTGSEGEALRAVRIAGTPLKRSVGVATGIVPRLPQVIDTMLALVRQRFEEIRLLLESGGPQNA